MCWTTKICFRTDSTWHHHSENCATYMAPVNGRPVGWTCAALLARHTCSFVLCVSSRTSSRLAPSVTLYTIGTWYKPYEIAKRAAIFTAPGQAGTCLRVWWWQRYTKVWTVAEGFKGGNAYFNWLDHHVVHRHHGLLYFPDTPELTKAPFLKSSERQLALTRLAECSIFLMFCYI